MNKKEIVNKLIDKNKDDLFSKLIEFPNMTHEGLRDYYKKTLLKVKKNGQPFINKFNKLYLLRKFDELTDFINQKEIKKININKKTNNKLKKTNVRIQKR